MRQHLGGACLIQHIQQFGGAGTGRRYGGHHWWGNTVDEMGGGLQLPDHALGIGQVRLVHRVNVGGFKNTRFDHLHVVAQLAGGVPTPVVATIATTGAGAAELLDVLNQASATKVLPQARERLRRLRKTLETMAAQELKWRLSMIDAAAIDPICESVLTGRSDFVQAIQQLLDRARDG